MAIHMVGPQPTLEGLLRTYNTARNGGHYIIEMAEVSVAPGRTEELEGRRVCIPREQVAWIQELK